MFSLCLRVLPVLCEECHMSAPCVLIQKQVKAAAVEHRFVSNYFSGSIAFFRFSETALFVFSEKPIMFR